MTLESEAAENQDFNISSSRETTVLELARMIFDLCETGRKFDWVSVPSFTYDVTRRIPATEKARATLGFDAEVRLEDGLQEVVGWLKQARLTAADQVAGRS